MDALSPVSSPSRARLQCPLCGQSRALTAGGMPAGLVLMRAICPRCPGHGHDDTWLLFDDGSMRRIAPPQARPTQRKALPQTCQNAC